MSYTILIFSSQPRKKSEVEIVEITEEVEEATVDDPEPAPENEVVEEDGMPAPQIKIGENGEIVVDERSLVIENKKTEMDREKIAKSQVNYLHKFNFNFFMHAY